MSMRVVAGKYRHRHLAYPEDDRNIRPTKDRIKEAFFSSIGNIEGKIFLDLCAGTGGMGIEAISRGAAFAYFVDNNKKSLSFLNKNIQSLQIENYCVLPFDILDSLNKIKDKNIKIDVVYFDPPYEAIFYEDVLSYLYNNDLLAANAIVAFEANKPIKLNPVWSSNIKEYDYGEIKVTVLR